MMIWFLTSKASGLTMKPSKLHQYLTGISEYIKYQHRWHGNRWSYNSILSSNRTKL